MNEALLILKVKINIQLEKFEFWYVLPQNTKESRTYQDINLAKCNFKIENGYSEGLICKPVLCLEMQYFFRQVSLESTVYVKTHYHITGIFFDALYGNEKNLGFRKLDSCFIVLYLYHQLPISNAIQLILLTIDVIVQTDHVLLLVIVLSDLLVGMTLANL